MSVPKRVSKRARKGQNKYLESLLQEENESFSLLMSNNDNDNNIKINREYTVFCNVCNTNDDNYDELTDPFGDMIQCDKCDTWQHINCILQNQNKSIENFFTENGKYICNQCDPLRYPHLKSLITQNNDNINDINSTIDQDYEIDNNYTINEENENNDKDLDLEDDIYESDNNNNNNNKRPKTQRKKKIINNKSSSKNNTTKQAKIEIKSDPKSNRIRDNASKMFIDLFNKFIIPETIKNNEYFLPKDKTVNDIAQEMGKSLEINLFDFVNEGKSIMINPTIYSEKVRMIYSNVKDIKNLKLKCHIMNGKLTLIDLVKLDYAQLINPDLQSFKKTIDSKIMDQVVFERPIEKPLYVKTHKGEELIERDNDNTIINDSNNNNTNNNDNRNSITMESDFLVKDNIMTTHKDDDEEDDDASKENIITTSSIEENSKTENVTINHLYSQKINIKIPDILLNPITLINNALYLSCSNNQLRHPYKECLFDGNLKMEGKLTTLKAYKYLNEIKSSRNILAYYLKDYTQTHYNEIVDWMLLNDKVIGLRCNKIYVKNIYLIASDSGEYPTIINDLYPKQEFSELIKYSEPKLFLLVVIKPELIH